MINTKQVLQDSKVDKIFFYTRTTSFLNNLYTTCILVDSKTAQIKARGVSICSVQETYSKDKGKKKAYGRAVMALIKKKNSEKINPDHRKDSSIIKRTIKLKNYTKEKFGSLVEEIKKVDPDFQIIETEQCNKILYSLPVWFPIKMANLSYRYKSQYTPKPATKEEVLFLKNIRKRNEANAQVQVG